MKGLWPGHRFTSAFERVVLSIFQVFLMLLLVVGVLDIGFLFISRIPQVMNAIDDGEQLQQAMLRGFSVALLILIGLELLETARSYLLSHYVRVEVVLIVAIIAVGRHMIMLDPHEASAGSMFAVAAMMVAATAGYFFVRRGVFQRREADADDPADSED